MPPVRKKCTQAATITIATVTCTNRRLRTRLSRRRVTQPARPHSTSSKTGTRMDNRKNATTGRLTTSTAPTLIQATHADPAQMRPTTALGSSDVRRFHSDIMPCRHRGSVATLPHATGLSQPGHRPRTDQARLRALASSPYPFLRGAEAEQPQTGTRAQLNPGAGRSVPASAASSYPSMSPRGTTRTTVTAAATPDSGARTTRKPHPDRGRRFPGGVNRLNRRRWDPLAGLAARRSPDANQERSHTGSPRRRVAPSSPARRSTGVPPTCP